MGKISYNLPGMDGKAIFFTGRGGARPKIYAAGENLQGKSLWWPQALNQAKTSAEHLRQLCKGGAVS